MNKEQRTIKSCHVCRHRDTLSASAVDKDWADHLTIHTAKGHKIYKVTVCSRTKIPILAHQNVLTSPQDLMWSTGTSGNSEESYKAYQGPGGSGHNPQGRKEALARVSLLRRHLSFRHNLSSPFPLQRTCHLATRGPCCTPHSGLTLVTGLPHCHLGSS